MRPLHGTETLGNVHQLMGVQDLTRTVLMLGSVHLKLYTHRLWRYVYDISNPNSKPHCLNSWKLTVTTVLTLHISTVMSEIFTTDSVHARGNFEWMWVYYFLYFIFVLCWMYQQSRLDLCKQWKILSSLFWAVHTTPSVPKPSRKPLFCSYELRVPACSDARLGCSRITM